MGQSLIAIHTLGTSWWTKRQAPPGPPFFDVTQVGEGDMPNMLMPMKRKFYFQGLFDTKTTFAWLQILKLSRMSRLRALCGQDAFAFWTGVKYGNYHSRSDSCLAASIFSPQPRVTPLASQESGDHLRFFTCFFTMIKL